MSKLANESQHQQVTQVQMQPNAGNTESIITQHSSPYSNVHTNWVKQRTKNKSSEITCLSVRRSPERKKSLAISAWNKVTNKTAMAPSASIHESQQ